MQIVVPMPQSMTPRVCITDSTARTDRPPPKRAGAPKALRLVIKIKSAAVRMAGVMRGKVMV